MKCNARIRLSLSKQYRLGALDCVEFIDRLVRLWSQYLKPRFTYTARLLEA